MVMHIHWIANNIIPPPILLSGGDRIMVECIRRWSKEHRVTVYGNEGARQLCDYFGLQGIEHETWPSDHWKCFGRPVWWLAQTIIGCQRIKKLNLSPDEKHLIFASSEFQPNSIPALRLKKKVSKREGCRWFLFLCAEMVFQGAGSRLVVHGVSSVSTIHFPPNVERGGNDFDDG